MAPAGKEEEEIKARKHLTKMSPTGKTVCEDAGFGEDRRQRRKLISEPDAPALMVIGDLQRQNYRGIRVFGAQTHRLWRSLGSEEEEESALAGGGRGIWIGIGGWENDSLRGRWEKDR